MHRAYVYTQKQIHARSWRSSVLMAIISIMMIQTQLTSAVALQYEGGTSHTFVGPSPPEGQSYRYQWIASDGFPLVGSDISFTWTAPDVTEPTNITMSLFVDSGAEGCTNESQLELLILPKSNIRIELECVRPNPDGSYAAKFTYDNPDDEIAIPKGDYNRMDPAPSSGSQPETFQHGHHSFTVNFDPKTPITWTLQGQQATATKESPSCSIGSPLVVTKVADRTAAYAGSIVTFTITVKNEGDEEVNEVYLVDTLSPGLIYDYSGTQPKPVSVSGSVLNWDLGTLEPKESKVVILTAILDPGLCPGQNIVSLDTRATDYERELNVQAAERESSNILEIIDSLTMNKTKLEAKLKSIMAHRDAFNRTFGTIKSSIKTIGNYTRNNYTNISTGEILTEELNATGFLVWSEYFRPAKRDLLRTEYGAGGEVVSDFYDFMPTKETLKIEYDTPDKGYKTYTVRCYLTGDTLIITVDPYGNVVSREYKKTPGLPQIFGPLKNCAKAYGIVGDTPMESNEACVEIVWSCQRPQPISALRVTKVADHEIAHEKEVVKYTYTVQNTGETSIVTLTLNDDKVGLVIFNEPVDLDPGDTLTYYADYTVKREDAPSLRNTVIASGTDENGRDVISDPVQEEVRIVEGCGLNKTASPKVVKPGDYITYTINWDRKDSYKIVEYFPSQVSFISASPPPSLGDNVWIVSEPSGTISIVVQVARDIGNTTFNMGQGVTGTGFVNVHNDIHTNPVILTNKAALYDKNDVLLCTASYDVVVGPPQTSASLREHGSGNYASEDVILYHNSNRSVEWNKSLKVTYRPTSFSLPGDRALNYATKWIERVLSKNYATGGSTKEEYTYATMIDREGYLKQDENGSTMITDTSFEGVGRIGLLKKDVDMNTTWNASQIFESHDDYIGKFQIYQKFDEYGKNVEFERSVNGTGYVAGARSIGISQRSYEVGTGKFQSDEKISTVVNYIAKDIALEHAPTSYAYTPNVSTASDLLWEEGMWSKTPNSLISERFSSAQSLQKESTAEGLSEMDTEAKASGQADFRTIYKDLESTGIVNEVDMVERYSGDFAFKRMTRLTGVAKYNRPHLTLTKEANVDLLNTTFADYRITVTNNGDRVLGPVYVKDIFPEGTEYISSSLRPSELTDGYCTWTLVSLGIGSKAIIDLRLNITKETANLVNRVQATGNSSKGWITAGNFSAVKLNWLTCCPPQIFASKTARIDPLDQKMVWYRLDIRNREEYSMVVFLRDLLPAGMQFINSSLEPSENNSRQISWTILDLGPGESKSIIYRARAAADGSYVNHVHIEAFSVDGPDSAAADVTMQVDLGRGGYAKPSSSSGWQIPACFALNCSDPIADTDWISCYVCGGGEQGNASFIPPCASCVDTGDDDLP